MRLLTCLLALAMLLLGGCQQEPEPPETDAIEPSVLEFAVDPSGEVSGPAAPEATAGDPVKLVLDNQSNQEYVLELTGSDGATVFTTRVAAGDRGQGNAQPRTPGSYRVEVHPAGEPDAGESFPVEVSET